MNISLSCAENSRSICYFKDNLPVKKRPVDEIIKNKIERFALSVKANTTHFHLATVPVLLASLGLRKVKEIFVLPGTIKLSNRQNFKVS